MWSNPVTEEAGKLTVNDSTITGNNAALGGGIFSWGDTRQHDLDRQLDDRQQQRRHPQHRRRRPARQARARSQSRTRSSPATQSKTRSPPNAYRRTAGTAASPPSATTSRAAADCAFTATGDLKNTEPGFLSSGLQDNGGNTDTLALEGDQPRGRRGTPERPGLHRHRPAGHRKAAGHGLRHRRVRAVPADRGAAVLRGGRRRLTARRNHAHDQLGRRHGALSGQSRRQHGAAHRDPHLRRGGRLPRELHLHEQRRLPRNPPIRCQGPGRPAERDRGTRERHCGRGSSTPRWRPSPTPIPPAKRRITPRRSTGATAPPQRDDRHRGRRGFAVIGSHTYASVGAYPTSVTITDVGGATATATSRANVAAAPPPRRLPRRRHSSRSRHRPS